MTTIIKKQIINCTLEEAWEFFSNPNNLEKITPKDVKFEILNKIPSTMYKGLIIHYKITAIANISMKWVNEITQVEALNYFVDHQLTGPYKIWHHQHHFKAVKEGVEITDIINYKMPFGFLGSIAEKLFIKNKINSIFQHRNEMLNLKFNQK